MKTRLNSSEVSELKVMGDAKNIFVTGKLDSKVIGFVSSDNSRWDPELQSIKPQEDALAITSDSFLKHFIELPEPYQDIVLALTFRELQNTCGNFEFQGSTGCSAIVFNDGKKIHVINANLGDSVLYTVPLIPDAKIEQINTFHKPGDEKEKNRIISDGGHVVNGRMNGGHGLNVSRGFGDTAKRGISHDVEIKRLNGEESIVLIASDGLYASYTVEYERIKSDIEDITKKHKEDDLETIGKALVDYARKNGSSDDVTIGLIRTSQLPVGVPVFAGVFDGHSGYNVSRGVAEHFCASFKKHALLSIAELDAQNKIIQSEKFHIEAERKARMERMEDKNYAKKIVEEMTTLANPFPKISKIWDRIELLVGNEEKKDINAIYLKNEGDHATAFCYKQGQWDSDISHIWHLKEIRRVFSQRNSIQRGELGFDKVISYTHYTASGFYILVDANEYNTRIMCAASSDSPMSMDLLNHLIKELGGSRSNYSLSGGYPSDGCEIISVSTDAHDVVTKEMREIVAKAKHIIENWIREKNIPIIQDGVADDKSSHSEKESNKITSSATPNPNRFFLRDSSEEVRSEDTPSLKSGLS